MSDPISVAIAYHSGYGHTARQAAAVAAGADSVPTARAVPADVGAIGAQACDVVFVDDLPRNVAGARAFGMVGIDLDLLRPRVAFERARVALGLDEAGIPAADPEQRLARGLRGSSWWPPSWAPLTPSPTRPATTSAAPPTTHDPITSGGTR